LIESLSEILWVHAPV